MECIFLCGFALVFYYSTLYEIVSKIICFADLLCFINKIFAEK